MHVLFVTPEIAPFLSVGGIGEGLGAMARALLGLGVQVSVALPAHASLRRDAEAPGIDLHVLDGPDIAGHADVYGDDVHDERNARRWGAFCRAVVALVRARRFDVVHLHEWPTAMVAYLLREERVGVPSVLTLHNLAHQGVFPPSCLPAFGLSPAHADDARLGFHGHVNLLKGGIAAADALTTVSPTYARQILEPPHGELLEGALRARAADLRGIVNGVDDAWDPRLDPAIAAPFHCDDLAGKATCRAALARELGFSGERPIVAAVGRVVLQKGSDLLAETLPRLADTADVAIAGTGDPALVPVLERAARGPHARYLGFVPEATVRRLIAGADLLAMPSRFEPCGIVQLYAMRYGTVPVAAATGGLSDTIADGDTGFLFTEPSAPALAAAIERAAEAGRSGAIDGMRARGMRLETSWRWRILPYLETYDRLAGRVTRPR